MVALSWAWFALVSTVIVIVAVVDWQRRLVPNKAVLALMALAVLFVLLGDVGPLVADRRLAFMVSGSALVAGLVLWAVGLIGGGDVKLVLPVALILSRLGAASWLWYLAVFIAATAVTLVVGRRRPGRGHPMAPLLGLGLIPALLTAPVDRLFQ